MLKILSDYERMLTDIFGSYHDNHYDAGECDFFGWPWYRRFTITSSGYTVENDGKAITMKVVAPSHKRECFDVNVINGAIIIAYANGDTKWNVSRHADSNEDVSKIEAVYKDGILYVKTPLITQKPEQKKIEVKCG